MFWATSIRVLEMFGCCFCVVLGWTLPPFLLSLSVSIMPDTSLGVLVSYAGLASFGWETYRSKLPLTIMYTCFSFLIKLFSLGKVAG
jgi:hypothetical protein